MFIKTIVKTDKLTGKRYDYYRLCEGYRIGGSVRHRTIVNMGKLEGIDSKEDKKFLADLIERKLRGENHLFSFDVKPEIAQYASIYANRIINEKLLDIAPTGDLRRELPKNMSPDYENLDINSIQHEDVREIGAEWLCKQTLDKLELGRFLEQTLSFSAADSHQAQMHIISRAVYPASEHKTAQWIKENSSVSELCGVPMDKVNYTKLYSISQKLYKGKIALEKYLSDKTNELFDIADKIIFYDLTNTYFEGRKQGSKLAKFAKSKEKRSDAKIVALAAVINAEGFLKHSRIYQGNIADNATLEQTIEELSVYTSDNGRKPVVVMDAGIISDDNTIMLKDKGYDYIAVSRTKLKEYTVVNPDAQKVVVYDKREHPIELKHVKKDGCTDSYLYVRSQQKAKKEASMNEHFSQRYEQDLQTIKDALSKKGGIKKFDKVCERIGRLKERYPTANKHYTISVVPDQERSKAIDVTWTKTPVKPKTSEGVYFIRTNLQGNDEKTIWTIYNTLTEIEATFRVLRTDLALRPVFHKTDQNIEAHLFLGLIAYQLVATIRYQLKCKNIKVDWRNIVRKMNTQKEVTSVMQTKKNKTIRIKKCSTPNTNVRSIYDALGLKHQPYYLRKSVVPDKTNPH